MSVLIELYTNAYAAPYAHIHSCINVWILPSIAFNLNNISSSFMQNTKRSLIV